ncbi:UvrD-helicase domain-containing protein [Ligilactobacillus salivarius]|uniref:UvrD-helicase domain-containing protein n=1 Tax=Ligilactobacillus salivarius TaxID=1624 RepID=UPI0006695560|nr:UvrD-helicase domain-containing protein [Ligilactobacillus salivarius]
MDKQIILAVAGAGKTYHICHSIDPTKRNLILAYTHENIHNIENELCDAYKSVPEMTTVMTFDSFVYRHLICPYEPSIAEHFSCPMFISNGICTIDPPPRQIKNAGGKFINPNYVAKDKLRHYVTNQDQYYCATLSELVLQVKKGRDSLLKRAAARLNLFYDYVLIDEFQDFRKHDYELIIALAKQLNRVMLVGDYHQHSVSATNNSGKPFKKGRKDVGYSDFISELQSAGFYVDTTTLNRSRRCSTEICDYVSKKLGINISSCDEHEGSVIWADDSATEILDNGQIVKLVFKGADKYSFQALNWSYSKGDTVNAACVVLTDRFEQLDNGDFSIQDIPVSTINKLYVVMTRSSGDLYLMKASTFKKVKDLYIKQN